MVFYVKEPINKTCLPNTELLT